MTGTPKPPCCGPCQNQMQSCRTDCACCLECHFAYEEKHCWPYLPPSARHTLKREHQWLKANGFPPDAVREHSQNEMRYFRYYCPANLVAQIDRDHHEYEIGALHSRASKGLR